MIKDQWIKTDDYDTCQGNSYRQNIPIEMPPVTEETCIREQVLTREASGSGGRKNAMP